MIELQKQSFTIDSVNKENIMELLYTALLMIGGMLLAMLLFYIIADIIIDMTLSFQSKIDKWKSNRWKQKVGLKRRK